jgi:recombining binding protein suppressor of hairless
VIRKVDKGRVSPDEGGPVSQMQKIALQRVNPDGSRHYLSAAGPIPGTPGVVAPPAPGMSTQAGTHPLLFQSPRVRDEMKDGLRIISDEVDDYLCWTIVGICRHSPPHLCSLLKYSNSKISVHFFRCFWPKQ